MSLWDQINGMLHAVGVGYVGAGIYILIIIVIFMFIVRRNK